jgi:hypothetical protein
VNSDFIKLDYTDEIRGLVIRRQSERSRLRKP